MTKLVYEFHHIGVPTESPKPNERYSALYKMYTSDDVASPFRKQWHRYEPGSSLDKRLQTRPHIAFKVNSLEEAIKNKTCLLGPYEPLERFKVAVYEEEGVLIEVIETSLTDEEIWTSALNKKSTLYPDKD